MGKRIEAARQRSRTQTALNQQADAIRGREANSFSSTSNDPFNSPKRDNYQTYPYDYFSGADCKIFFGDIWVDDIITIQFNVNQGKAPIYGYASQLFNAVVRGQVLVEGTLSIAFKETGYLNLIQGIIETQKKNAGEIIKNKVDQQRTLSDLGMVKFIPRLNYIGEDAPSAGFSLDYSPNGNPQIIRQQQTVEQILASKKASKALSSNLLNDKVNTKNRDFEDFAEVLEDTIWGDSNGNPFSTETKLKRADEFDYLANGGVLSARGKDYSQVLNILLTFGDINDYRAEHTLVALNDVHFTSTNMIVSPTGDPIAETYTFFARNVNDSISKEIKLNINPIKLNVGNDSLTLSKISDIDTVEQFLNQNPNMQMFINLEACLDQYGWHPVTGNLELNFTPNQSLPFVDQLCTAVERAMNDIRVPQLVDASKEQYIIKVSTGGFEGLTPDITMILEQGVVNTRSYRVISPTRTGFAAPSIVTREELFMDIGELPKPLDIAKSKIDENRAKLEAGEKAALDEKKRIEGELGTLGTADEAKTYNDRKKQLQELQDKANRDGKISAWEQYRINNAQARVDKAEAAYATELVKPLSDRDLNRRERDNMVDLTNAYNQNAATLNTLSQEEQLLIGQETRFESLIDKQRQQEYDQAHKANEDAIKLMEAADRATEIKRIQDQAAIDGKKIDEQIAALEDKLRRAEVEETIANARKVPPKDVRFNPQTAQDVMKQWGPKIKDAQAKLGSKVPTEFLVAIIAQESAGNINAKSAAGAEGLAQFMPATYGEIMQKINKEHPEVEITPVVGVYSPNNSILALVEYTNQLYDRAGGDLAQVAAAYNAGPGALKESRSDPRYQIWSNPVNTGYRETQNYVPSVMSRYETIKSNDQFSFMDKDPDAPVSETTSLANTPIIDQTVIKVPEGARDLYGGTGASYLNVRFVETIPLNANGPKARSEGYNIIKAQTPPQNPSKDTAQIYVALKNQYGTTINPFDVAFEVAHEDAHIQQIRNLSTRKLEKDRQIAYEIRPTEIEARENASRNSASWTAQYYTEFAKTLNRYNQSIGSPTQFDTTQATTSEIW